MTRTDRVLLTDESVRRDRAKVLDCRCLVLHTDTHLSALPPTMRPPKRL
jgi:hypothetical protein